MTRTGRQRRPKQMFTPSKNIEPGRAQTQYVLDRTKALKKKVESSTRPNAEIELKKEH